MRDDAGPADVLPDPLDVLRAAGRDREAEIAFACAGKHRARLRVAANRPRIPRAESGPGTSAYAASILLLSCVMESRTTRTRSRFGVPTTVLAAPWRWLTLPQLYGLENLCRATDPSCSLAITPSLGLLDAPLLVLEIADRCGVELRSLGDHVHFRLPGWRTLLASWGTVEGDPDNCRAPHAGSRVDPGAVPAAPARCSNARERSTGSFGATEWASRVSRSSTAIRSCRSGPSAPRNATTSCSTLGTCSRRRCSDPCSAVFPRGRTRSRRSSAASGSRRSRDSQRFYFSFAPPIETTRFALASNLTAPALAVRELVRASIEAEIAFLLDERPARSRARPPAAARARHPTRSSARTERRRIDCPDASAPWYAGAGTTSGR